VSVVIAADARHYVDGLTSYRAGDVGAWCADFAEALTVAGERAVGLGREMAELRSSWLERADSPNRGSTARRIIDGLPGHPIISVESAATLLGVSNEAARTALNRLELAGVLRLVTVGRRNRAWAALEVFELLDEFDATVGARGRSTD
jgi:hypothetical protein